MLYALLESQTRGEVFSRRGWEKESFPQEKSAQPWEKWFVLKGGCQGREDEFVERMVAGVTMRFQVQKRMTITVGDDGNASSKGILRG